MGAIFPLGLLLVLAAAVSSPVVAGPQFSPDRLVEVESVWARMAPNEDNTASVFFNVVNHSTTADELISASSPAAREITLRRGKWRGWNFFNRETEGIRIKAIKRTSFRPGAYEVTLRDFNGPVGVRSVIPVTLMFKNAGPVMIEATVANQLLGNRIKK
jgi:copper(I)-binding protein